MIFYSKQDLFDIKNKQINLQKWVNSEWLSNKNQAKKSLKKGNGDFIEFNVGKSVFKIINDRKVIANVKKRFDMSFAISTAHLISKKTNSDSVMGVWPFHEKIAKRDIRYSDVTIETPVNFSDGWFYNHSFSIFNRFDVFVSEKLPDIVPIEDERKLGDTIKKMRFESIKKINCRRDRIGYPEYAEIKIDNKSYFYKMDIVNLVLTETGLYKGGFVLKVCLQGDKTILGFFRGFNIFGLMVNDVNYEINPIIG